MDDFPKAGNGKSLNSRLAFARRGLSRTLALTPPGPALGRPPGTPRHPIHAISDQRGCWSALDPRGQGAEASFMRAKLVGGHTCARSDLVAVLGGEHEAIAGGAARAFIGPGWCQPGRQRLISLNPSPRPECARLSVGSRSGELLCSG